MTHEGPPQRHLHPVEPPFDPDYDTPRRDTPPNDGAAERSVLGALLLDPTLIKTIATEVDPADYWRPAHETIHQTILDLHNNDQPVDAITVADELQRRGDLPRIGGATYLHDLITAVPVTAHAHHYAKIVRDQARLRAMQAAGQRLTALASSSSADQADTILADAVDTLDQALLRFGPRQTGTSPWAPLNLDQVLAGEEVDPPPALLARTDGAHLLYTGAVHTLSGEPGSGKTWIALIAALQTLTHGGTVTMIDFEDRASRVIGRLLALGAHPDTIRDHFRYIRPHNALDPTSRPDLDHAIHGATLVILDGVTEAMTLHGLELEKNADIARFYDLLPRHIADTSGAAVVLIDHVVKDSEKQGRWGIGGQHKLAGIDGVAYLVKATEPFGRGKTGHARVTVSKDRPGYVEEIAFGRTVAELTLDATDIKCLRHTLAAPTEAPTDETGNMRPTHLMEKVSRWLELTPGASRTQVETGVSGKVTYLRRAIDRLVQEGYVEVRPGPRNTQQHHSITPFREHEDTTQERLYD